MRTLALLTLSLCLIGCCAPRRARIPAMTAAAPVAAKRYKIQYAESAMDLAHGASQMVDEVFVPSRSAAVFVVRDWHWSEDGEMVEEWKAVATTTTEPRSDLTGWNLTTKDQNPPSAVTDMVVPPDLARQMQEYAMLTERWKAEGKRLGARLARVLDLKLKDAKPAWEQ